MLFHTISKPQRLLKSGFVYCMKTVLLKISARFSSFETWVNFTKSTFHGVFPFAMYYFFLLWSIKKKKPPLKSVFCLLIELHDSVVQVLKTTLSLTVIHFKHEILIFQKTEQVKKIQKHIKHKSTSKNSVY